MPDIEHTPFAVTIGGRILDANGDQVGEVYPSYLDRRSMHIARSFAAAPDLLHACRVAISECKGCQGGDPDCGWPVCSIARAAIAKARGE